MMLLHKTENQKNNSDQLIRLMAPTIAGILACVFCLVSMTWAWFTASVNMPAQTIQSASRSTSVVVYEVSQAKEEKNMNITKTLVKPKTAEALSTAEDEQTADEDVSVVMAGDSLVWELSPEKSYEVEMTGSGTASTGYCEIALSYAVSGEDTPETKIYQTSAFEKDANVTFTYNTGGFPKEEGVTETQYKEYIEKTTPPTLTIASHWGKPAEDEESQAALMSARKTVKKEIMLLSDGDVLGLAPIPCPEAKAETAVELEGFEAQEGAQISAEEDYKILLALKEGYEMPGEVVVNIDGKDYVVSTQGAEESEDAPYYDAHTSVLTVPSVLLSDGVTVSVKATATPVPEEKPEELEEITEETVEETADDTTEETADNNETKEDNSDNTSSGNTVVADNPSKKEDDDEKRNDEPHKTPTGDGGNDDSDDEDEDDNNSAGSSTDNTSSTDNGADKAEDEKADVTLKLSQLTINLEETKIPTNADLVLTLSAKEDNELPEQIVITLDKTIRDEDIDDENIDDENINDEKIEEDKTEYIINTDGEDNPEGFSFNTENGELTISSELLEGVREIIISDAEENKADEDDEKAALTFEVKNLTFDFTDDEIVTDEDVVITFTAGEGYELPETIVITIDGEEYIVYTGEEDADKNPDGITFDIETGALTISKDLLEDAESITITAEGVEKEDEESDDKEENTDVDKKDEPGDSNTDDNESNTETEGSETVDKENENGTDVPGTEDKTEPEGGTEAEAGENTENTETTIPETTPENTTEEKEESKTETPESETEPAGPTTSGAEGDTKSEQNGEDVKTEENGEDSTENETEETTEPTQGAEKESDAETPSKPEETVVTPTEAPTSAPDTSETSIPGETTQASVNTSGAPASAASGISNNSNGVGQTTETITPERKETSSEE